MNIIWPPQELLESQYGGGVEKSGTDLEQQAIDIALGSCHTDGRSKEQLGNAVKLMLRNVNEVSAEINFKEDNPYF